MTLSNPQYLSVAHQHINCENFFQNICRDTQEKNFSFVRDSKWLASSLKRKIIKSDETLVSYDASILFTSIPMPAVLEVINRKLTDHISQDRLHYFFEHSHEIPKDKLITLLELVLDNCVFSFQNILYKQLQGPAMDSPLSPVIANIYMEYFEELALWSQCPIPTPW